MTELSNEHVIEKKIELYRQGRYKALRLSDKQIQAMEVLCDDITDELLFGGAAGGAKSWLGCEWLLWNCLSYPGTKWFVGRHHLTEIRDTTIETFKKVCRKHKIPDGYFKYNEGTVKVTFKNGSVIKGIEMMQRPGDKDFDRFGSSEYTGGWIEEGGGIEYSAYEVAGTRIGRHWNDKYGIRGKLLITGNPSRNWMYSLFYKPDKDGRLPVSKKFIKSLLGDNPFRESGYEEKMEKLTGATRQRLVLGNWDYVDDPLALVDPEAIQDLYTNDFVSPDVNDKCLVVDVAMSGGDKLRAGVFYGMVMMEQKCMPKSGGMQVFKLIKELQGKHGIPASKIIYDADGVGAFIGGDGGFIPGSIPFHAQAQPFIIIKSTGARDIDKRQKEVSEYSSLKDQCGFLAAEDINEGRMWAKCVTSQEDRDILTSELSHIKRSEQNPDGKLRLMSKRLIVISLGWSPDFADLFIMRKYFDLKKLAQKKPFNRPLRGA